MKILITGTAGFIGFHTAKRYLSAGHEVIGLDGYTEYYDPSLKRRRTEVLNEFRSFTALEGMLEDAALIMEIVTKHQPELVIHLAAQAGVRYSIENPNAYVSSNVLGTFNLLEALRHSRPKHFMFASTSSVYGGNEELPFSETVRTSFPVSLYAATKSAGESMTHSYSHLFNVPTTCFRFFTVYGPWGRPDMALFKFVDLIQRGEAIDVYGHGKMSRDFTYIDDLVEGIHRLAEIPPEDAARREKLNTLDSVSPVAPWRVVNIAGGTPVPLTRFITAIEDAMGVHARKNMLPMQDGDVHDTLASADLLFSLTGFRPKTPIEDGVRSFVDWYLSYHGDDA